MSIDGETRITGLIGDPVAHSRSPAILNTAYREAGLNWIYVAFPVPRGQGGDAVRGARALRFAGLNVTMPHKADAAGRVRRAHARRHRARRRSTWSPSPTTDACAVRRPTARASSARCATRAFDPAGTDVLVAGAGGAARAIVLALGGAGARRHGRGAATRRRRVGRRAGARRPGRHAG